jgi:SAM-dependent methyltransferase
VKETSKANRRRKLDPFWISIFKGSGIDIGAGKDPFDKSQFSWVTSIRTFDVADGDAQNITDRVKDQFDFVYSSNCLEHLPSPGEALKKWWSLVKPGGHLVITIPDEDLYEQGVWPSRWNTDHQWSFTIWKKKSWSPKSLNVAELISELKDCQVLKLEIVDANYDHSLTDTDQTELSAEAFIEVVLRKRCLPTPIPGTLKHSGARGDIIYSLPTIAGLGGGELYLVCESGAYVETPMSKQELKWMRELLVGQCGITDVDEWDGEPVAHNLDRFRHIERRSDGSLALSHSNAFKIDVDFSLPWLDRSKFEPLHIADIVVNRTSRYEGPLRWQELKGFESRTVFVGFDDEWEAFKKFTGLNVPIHRPQSYVEICRVLLGSKLFIGNQSFVYSLAEALKVNRVQEACLRCPNCLPQGPNGHIILTRDILDYYVLGKGKQPQEFQKARSLFNIRNRFFGTTLPRPPKSIETVAGRPLISCVVISESENIPAGIAKGLEAMPSKEVLVVRKSEGYEAVNKVVSKTSGEFICLLEEGVEVAGTWFLEMLEAMIPPQVGAVGQKLVVEPVQHLPGGVVLIRRRAWQECGLFSSDGQQWVYFATRLRAHGYTLRQVRSANIKEKIQ